jgi:hypothetical protein
MVNFAINESIKITKMDYQLNEGLIYARIFFTEGIVGNFFGLEGKEIVQERMPLGQFMQRAGDEVKVYQPDSLKKSDQLENSM